MLYALIVCVGTIGVTQPDICQLSAQSYSSFFTDQASCEAQAARYQSNASWAPGKAGYYSCELLTR